MPAGVVSVGVLADFAELIQQSEAAGMSIEAFSGKVVTSARTASRAMADYAKAQGASAEEAKAAAAKTAAAWDATYGSMSRSSKDAGNAALATSRMFKESADAQTAAFARAAEAQKAFEVQQKAAADAGAAAAAKTAAAAEASAARVAAAEKKLAGLGKWALFGGAAAVAVSVKGAADLQTAMERLHTQAGVSQSAINGLTSSVLNMSGSLATAPTALAQSLYHVESGGVHGAAALKVMATAAKEAKVSGADLTDTTTALTATVFSGIAGAQDYAKAMGLLNATVGAGDMTFQDLNEALGGPMLATVKGYGLSLKDVGAAMATFGDLNIRGADAATQLRMAVQYMARPAATAGPILEKLGLSTSSFADAMSKGGLLPALDLLNEKLRAAGIPRNDYANVISEIFSKKGASGITILENSLEKLKTKYTEVGRGANQVNEGWVGWNKTLAADVDHLKATVQSLADKLGTALIPKFSAAAHAASDVISWLERNKSAAEALGITIASVLGTAVAVFAYQKATAFVSGVAGMVSGTVNLGAKLLGLSPVFGGAQTETAVLTKAIQDLNVNLAMVPGDAERAGFGIESMGAAASAATPEVASLDAALGSSGLMGTVASLGGKLGLLSVGFGAFEAIKQTPGIGNIFGDGKGPKNSLPMPTPGETERNYIAQNLGLPAGYKGPLTAAGVIHARVQQGYPAEKSLIEQVFRQLNQVGHFGHHGFVPGAPGAAPLPAATVNLTPAGLKAAQTHLSGFNGTEKVNAALIMRQLVQGGLSGAGAAALAGNWVQESGLTPNEPGGLLAQWGGPRLTAEHKYAAAHGLPYNSIGAETGFALQELQSTPTLLAALQGKDHMSPSQLALAVSNMYEKDASAAPGAGLTTAPLTATAYERLGNVPKREQYAQQIFAAFGGKGYFAASPGGAGTTTGGGGLSILNTLQNLGTGAKIPAIVEYEAARSRATRLGDEATRTQAVGQAQVTVLQAINQRLQDQGAAQVQAMKDAQTVTDQAAAIQLQATKNQTQMIQDASTSQVAAIKDSATLIADAANAQATLITDNARTTADTISERGLYGLNLVVQKLQVTADETKASWDKQLAADQATLDNDQRSADVANALAQKATDQVTATWTLKELNAQQNLNMVTLKQDAAVNAAKAHLDAVTISQDNRILRATQHADAVQLSVDTTKIGPAQTAVDMSANSDKTTQAIMQANLKLATAQGNEQINAAQLQLAKITSSANQDIGGAQNSFQAIQNTANAQIQQATDAYQSILDEANQSIANAQLTQATTAAQWAQTLAADQASLSGDQGKAATAEASAQGNVTTEQALASTQFAGSGLVVNVYGVSGTDPSAIGEAASWAIRSSGLATV